MALVPLPAAGGPSAARLATSAALFGVGLWLLRRGLPRRERIVLDLDARTLVRGKKREPLVGASSYCLAGSDDVDGSATKHYRVLLVFADGHHECLLEGPDPARILKDLGALLRAWPLPVQRGWGVPSKAVPWSPALNVESPPPVPSEIELRGTADIGQSSAALSLSIGGGLVLLIVLLILLSRVRRGESLSAVSLALPGLSLALLAAYCACSWTARLRLRSGEDTLKLESRVLGIVTRRLELSRATLRAAYAVTPGGSGAHVLLETSSGPRAFATSADSAGALARAIDPR